MTGSHSLYIFDSRELVEANVTPKTLLSSLGVDDKCVSVAFISYRISTSSFFSISGGKKSFSFVCVCADFESAG